MSRTVSNVETCRSRPPLPRAQLAASAFASSTFCCTSAALSGEWSMAKNASRSTSHRTGALAPVPRGSHETMSKLLRSFDEKTEPAWRTRSTPEAPGPPGLVSRAPTRWPEAGRRASAREMCGPFGRAASSGTDRVAHWMAPHPCQPTEPVRARPPDGATDDGDEDDGNELLAQAPSSATSSAAATRAVGRRPGIGAP